MEISVTTADDRVTIRIHDTGVGIPAHLLSRVGTAFEQASNDPMLAREGTGLGLALVKALVFQHGGTINIESRENIGTIVSVDLPRARLVRAAA